MLYCDILDVYKGIDVNKTSASKECITSHYWYFLNEGSQFQLTVSNSCHNVVMMSIW